MQTALVIAGIEIWRDGAGRYNLNCLHRASGADRSKEPGQWIRRQETQDLILEWKTQDVNLHLGVATEDSEPVVTIHGGNAPGTFGIDKFAVAYAAWIDPSFHLLVLQSFVDLKEGRLPMGVPQALRFIADDLERVDQKADRGIEIGTRAEQKADQLFDALSRTNDRVDAHYTRQLEGERREHRRLALVRKQRIEIEFSDAAKAHFLDLWPGRDCMMPGCHEKDIIRRKLHEWDHFIPSSRDGRNSISNMGLICKICNGRKTNKLIPEYRPRWLIEKLQAQEAQWAEEFRRRNTQQKLFEFEG
jgi:5-methylcytosine-specific restriction endonuclease McrA